MLNRISDSPVSWINDRIGHDLRLTSLQVFKKRAKLELPKRIHRTLGVITHTFFAMLWKDEG